MTESDVPSRDMVVYKIYELGDKDKVRLNNRRIQICIFDSLAVVTLSHEAAHLPELLAPVFFAPLTQ